MFPVSSPRFRIYEDRQWKKRRHITEFHGEIHGISIEPEKNLDAEGGIEIIDQKHQG